ncbi:hypothetical protein KUTeg_023575 [Tegillarca granosa]|uniref:Uncharacterized protein n=1 Tax=Tegillarca granosa TaxID=220873 RepID=A0ABQ9E7P2_TEGGR|nr:hypothetical protein KUTeg_023575 [Tegillarca granosa]
MNKTYLHSKCYFEFFLVYRLFFFILDKCIFLEKFKRRKYYISAKMSFDKLEKKKIKSIYILIVWNYIMIKYKLPLIIISKHSDYKLTSLIQYNGFLLKFFKYYIYQYLLLLLLLLHHTK